ncbi:MAG TPA: 50S ribosomal protein L23 [Ktedonobacterales bacterium]|nr:50S ribosomal protein L23 [Ktedonobacterales bacterium]
MELTEVIRHGIVTEKSVNLQQQNNQYTFKVALTANKIEIKKAVESLFNVTVLKVSTVRMPGKSRRVYTLRGRRMPQVSEARPWKKAIVTLAEGQSISELQA